MITFGYKNKIGGWVRSIVAMVFGIWEGIVLVSVTWIILNINSILQQ